MQGLNIMNTTLAIKQDKIIDTVAHFLLINSEAFKSNGVKGKMPLLFFFFSYAKKYDKEHYSQFAFEVLEGVLIEELSTIENHQVEENSKMAGIGWSLIKFIEDDYFESDDLEDILSIIDRAVFLEVERLSRTDFEISYIIQLIGLGLYLKERIDLINENEVKILEIKEYLFITLFEINTNIKCIPVRNFELFELCKTFFNDGITHKIVAPFCIEGLNIINGLTPKTHNKRIIKNYKVLLEKETFESVLVYNSFFCGIVKNYKTNSLINIEDYADKLIKNLYLEPENNTNNNLQRLLIFGIYLIYLDKEVEQKSFQLYLLGFLFNSIENE